MSDEKLRGLVNAGQLYETWKDVMVQLANVPGGMYWRVINSKEYLYKYATDPAGFQQTKSLGPRTSQTEDAYRDFKKKKKTLEDRRAGVEARIKELAPAWRALRLPAIDRSAGRILRALDQANLVGTSVLVIGTYALKAYEVESASSFSAGMDATEDLDFTLCLNDGSIDPDVPRRLLLTLKQVDPSFIVSTNSAKTLVNKDGYKIDLLTNNSVAPHYSTALPWKPEALEGQEWLLLGKPVNAVLIDFEGWPVQIAVPDPRYFALHKLWLSKRKGRPAAKRVKDERQGKALMEAIKKHMDHYALDDEFVAKLPAALRDQLPPVEEPGSAARARRKPGPRR
ncbi:MAG: hypothetical protein HY017_03705 [Betaproteobacteria bacterium]|nr:hypothetical protein [Betaproteobacteria bacterium]